MSWVEEIRRERFYLAFLLSLFLHIVTFVGVLSYPSWKTYIPPFFIPLPKSLSYTPRTESVPVELVSPPLLQRQVVDAPPLSTPPPKEKAFLGVKDQSTPREQIARNFGKAENTLLSTPPHKTSEVLSPEKPLKRDRLLPSPLEQYLKEEKKVASFPKEYGGDQTEKREENGEEGKGEGESTQPNKVDRPFGKVTLLNTKSHPFSEYLIERGWRALRLLTLNVELSTWFYEDVKNLHFPTEVVAVVDGKGVVKTTTVTKSSGSSKVDRILLNALEGALTGFPPPAQALNQGFVEIVLILGTDSLTIGIR